MSGNAPREGFFDDIVDKFKDLINNEDDDNRDAEKSRQDPPLTPQCCGPPPPTWPVAGMPVEHDPNCPNHPDYVAKEGVAS